MNTHFNATQARAQTQAFEEIVLGCFTILTFSMLQSGTSTTHSRETALSFKRILTHTPLLMTLSVVLLTILGVAVSVVGIGYIVMKNLLLYESIADMLMQDHEKDRSMQRHMRKLEAAALQHYQLMDLERLQQAHRVELASLANERLEAPL